MIDAQTGLVGLIGWPVEHSLSPVMHNAAFAALGLDWCYVPLPVRPGRVQDAVRGLVALGFQGANVTLPHKRAVQQVLDEVDADARDLGAVNTLVVRQGEDGSSAVTGHNTDVQGFLQALRQGGCEWSQPRRAVVVGAGGAGRAVLFGLLQSGAQDIVLFNRGLERARAVVRDFNSPPELRAMPFSSDALVRAVQEADLLVNATPVGMSPHLNASIWPDGERIPEGITVFDVVYHPQQTRLLQQASASGARRIDGLGMLVAQGALAFELWTGVRPPREVMRDACLQVLKG